MKKIFLGTLLIITLLVIAFISVYNLFTIPTKSLKPNIIINDIVMVNRHTYGFKLPFTDIQLFNGKSIERGELIAFKYPKNTRIIYLKRVIGLPNDKIFYDNDNLTINGKKIPLKKIGEAKGNAVGSNNTGKSYDVYEENLFGVKYSIRHNKANPTIYPNTNLIVPDGQLFVMGDNRDESGDSRAFGFVPIGHLIGRVKKILINKDCLLFKGNCDRFLKPLK